MLPERVQRYGRWLTAQQKDEGRQDYCDKKRLVRQHPSDLLCSLIRERDRQRTAWHCLDSALSFADQSFHVLGVRHMMRMRIPSILIGPPVQAVECLEPDLQLAFFMAF